MNQPDIVRANEPGTYYIRAPETRVVHTWTVGDRYEPVKVLGEGSFSCVVQAVDRQTGQKVALKRVGDVLASIDNAKRVIRECAILRRLHHPNIVALMDLFTKPSSTGRWVYRGGKLVPTSIDLYMVLEYCSQGDLFHLKGQISAIDVQHIMWQLLEVLKYIHTCQVWHRDVKSANVLISLEHGRRVAKLCDFGSARSASRLTGDGGMFDPSLDSGTAPQQQHKQSARSLMTRPNSGTGLPDAQGSTITAGNYQARGTVQTQQQCNMAPQDSMALDVAMRCQSLELQATLHGQFDADKHPASSNPGRDGADHDTGRVRQSDLYARPSLGPRGGFDQPLTRAVCTPCYRAPEVVMSHGQYSSALDMWSLGCVFGELLQRVTYPGKAATPHLQVAPVIAVTGFPATPKTGDHFNGPGNETTCKELAALFNVVGTPSWGTIDTVVQHPAWHAYLKRLPGRSSQLLKRFAMSGEQSVDFLSRLLEFDPRRRATAEEAQSHEYFDNLKELFEMWAAEEEEDRLHDCDVHDEDHTKHDLTDVQIIPTSSPEPSRGVSHDGHAPKTIDMECSYEQVRPALQDSANPHLPGAIHAASANYTASQPWIIQNIKAHDVAQRALTGAGSAQSGSLTLGALTASEPSSPMSMDRESSELGYMHLFHVQQAEQAAKILAALEDELEKVCEVKDSTALSNGLRQLLERECTEHQEALAASAAKLGSSRLARSSIPCSGSSAEVSELEGQATPSRMATPGFDAMSYSDGGGAGTGYHHKGGVAKAGRSRRLGSKRRNATGLQPDPGVKVDPSDLGKERLPHHRDAEQAAVTPEQHLRAGRHQEWVPTSLAAAAAGGRQDKDKQQGQAASSGCWGVSLVPPGMEEQEMSPGLMEAIRQQHAR